MRKKRSGLFRASSWIQVALCASSLVWSDAFALEAGFETSRGDFVVALDVDASPLGVTRFVQLVDGSAPWLDTETGELRRDSYFDGLGVNRVGSGPDSEQFFGFGTVGGEVVTGFVIRDEPSLAPRYDSYFLSFAGDGPNRNGGAFVVNGSRTSPLVSGRSIVLGQVPEGPGRAVVDAIIAAGAGETTIESVTISGRAESEEALQEAAARLPVLSRVETALSLTDEDDVRLDYAQSGPAVLWVSESEDLRTWQPGARVFESSSPAETMAVVLEREAGRERSFFRPVLATYPEEAADLGPDSLAGRILEIENDETGILIYQFDETGRAGTYENILIEGEDPFLSGDFTVDAGEEFELTPYSTVLTIDTEGLGGAEFQRVFSGWFFREQELSGFCRIELLDGKKDLIFEASGSSRLREVP